MLKMVCIKKKFNKNKKKLKRVKPGNVSFVGKEEESVKEIKKQ